MVHSAEPGAAISSSIPPSPPTTQSPAAVVNPSALSSSSNRNNASLDQPSRLPSPIPISASIAAAPTPHHLPALPTHNMTVASDSDLSARRPPLIHSMIAGGLGGACGDMLMHSLDTVKTRQQGDRSIPPKYTSLASSYYTIFREEGIRRGLYGGWVPALSGSLPGTVIFFGVYESTKRYMLDHGVQPHVAYLTSGFLGDLAMSAVYVPSEVLKTRLQLQGRYNNPCFQSGHNYRSTIDAIRTIVREEGASALFYGFRATLYRDLPFSALQLTFYEQGQSWARKLKQSEGIGWRLEMLTGAAAGGLAGILSCPLDVVKTQVQTQVNVPGPAPPPQRLTMSLASSAAAAAATTKTSRSDALGRAGGSMYAGLKHLYQTEGLAGWFRGVGPRAVWTSIQSGCMFFLYQKTLRKLEMVMPLERTTLELE